MIQRQSDGTILVPMVMRKQGVFADGLVPLTPDHPQYTEWKAWVAAHGNQVVREAYNPDEPRDDHGRWGDGGGGGKTLDAKSAVPIDAPHPVRFDKEGFAISPQGSGEFTTRQVRQMNKAVADGVARSPELATGRNPLANVSYLSAGKPTGLDDQEWNALQPHLEGAQAVTLSSDSTSTPDGFSHVGGERIIVNDLGKFDPSTTQAPSTLTPYGVMTHEIGHAFFLSHGIGTNEKAADVLIGAGLKPYDLATHVSEYAASSPVEALGEMYGMAHTPGFSLDPAIAPAYQQIEAAAAAQSPRYSDYTFPPIGVLRNDPVVNQQVKTAAAANVRAGAWVMDVPALAWRNVAVPTPPVDHFAEAARDRGFSLSDIRLLREDYNPDEPRDDHGRWGDGGGSSKAETTGPVGQGSGNTFYAPGLPPGAPDPQAEFPHFIGKPGGGSRWTDDQQAQVVRAVSDQMAARPDLFNKDQGTNAIHDVSFLSNSQGKPDGLSTSNWDKMLTSLPPSVEALTTWDNVREGTHIVINDTSPINNNPGVTPASNSAYGAVTHEIGHGLFAQVAGVGQDPNVAVDLLNDANLGPVSLHGLNSEYALSDPREALAELYSAANVPGFSLPADIQPKYDSLLSSVGA